MQIDADNYLGIECLTFTNGLYSLIGAIPNMMSYLEQGYFYFRDSFMQTKNNTTIHIPIKTDNPS